MNRLFSILVVVGLFLASPLLSAESFPAGVEETMNNGAVLHAKGEFIAAALEFRKAFEIAPYALFAYNAARSYHEGQSLRQAHAEYEVALSIDDADYALPEEYRVLALSYRAELEKPVEEERRWTNKWWIGTGVASTGGALLLVSAVFGNRASSGIERLSGVDNETSYKTQRLEVESDQSMGRAFLWSGVGLLAVGTGVFVWDALTIDTIEVVPHFVFPKEGGLVLGLGGAF